MEHRVSALPWRRCARPDMGFAYMLPLIGVDLIEAAHRLAQPDVGDVDPELYRFSLECLARMNGKCLSPWET
jgi:hypothetical protein